MRFQNPLILLLEVVVVALGWYLLRRRRDPFMYFPSLKWHKALDLPLQYRFPRLPQALFVTALAIAVIAMARPQVRGGGRLTGKGSDFMIAMDMSASMNAVDMSPERINTYHAMGKEPPNRFRLAINTIKRFILSREEDRIGLVVFSEKAFLMFPPTLDYDAIFNILDGLVLDDGRRNGKGGCMNDCTIPGGATAIGDALAKAYNRLRESKAKSKNIILITDGANNAGKIQPETVAKYINDQPKEKRAKIFSFLVGSPKYTYTPVVNPFNGEFMRQNGMLVYQEPRQALDINPKLLAKVSKMTSGIFFRTVKASDFRKAFAKLAKTRFKMPKKKTFNEAFAPVLSLAFLLMALGEILALTVYRRFP